MRKQLRARLILDEYYLIRNIFKEEHDLSENHYKLNRKIDRIEMTVYNRKHKRYDRQSSVYFDKFKSIIKDDILDTADNIISWELNDKNDTIIIEYWRNID